MAFLQRWLEEDDEAIARFTAVFYVLAFVFMALFGIQIVWFLWFGDGPVERGEAGQLFVSLFLTSIMYNLAIDGRRSHKTLKAKGKDSPVR